MNDGVQKEMTDNPLSMEEADKLLDAEVVVLMKGRNVYDDMVYSYLKLTVHNLMKLEKAMKSGEQFMPADFGEVLAAGKGEPDDEIKSEMAVKYNVVSLSAGAPEAPKEPAMKNPWGRLEAFFL